MNQHNDYSETPARRKSDLPLLGNTIQDFNNKVYTLDFKVNLSQITFEGLNNYAVILSCLDKNTQKKESISSVVNIRLHEKNNSISLEGGPFVYFSVGPKTLDLSDLDIELPIVEAMDTCIDYLKKGETGLLIKNRRKVPVNLLHDRIAINLLMSAVSTIIAGAAECHNKTVKEKQTLFTQKTDYIDSMYESLLGSMDSLTAVAINRGVQYYVNSS